MKWDQINARREWRRTVATAMLLLAAFAMCAFAQAAAPAIAWAPFDLPKLQQTILKSAAGAPYRIVVAAPAAPAPAKGYPVIYVVDGNAWTGIIAEIIRTNIEFGLQSAVEPAVVVGIGYPINDAFDMKRRTLDLTSPVPPERVTPEIGNDPTGGDIALMDFIDSVVKPTVQARFPIDRNRQTMMGHSLGGLFTLRTMFNRPQSFQTYAALSPSIWWDNRAVMKEAQTFVKRTDRPQKLRVFLSAGTLEQYMTPRYIAHARDVLRRYFKARGKTDADAEKVLGDLQAANKSAMVENAREMAALLDTAHIQSKFLEFADEDHFSVLPPALGRAVPFALGDELPVR
jgi:predicted alpha/beta superfamily hydrolase